MVVHDLLLAFELFGSALGSSLRDQHTDTFRTNFVGQLSGASDKVVITLHRIIQRFEPMLTSHDVEDCHQQPLVRIVPNFPPILEGRFVADPFHISLACFQPLPTTPVSFTNRGVTLTPYRFLDPTRFAILPLWFSVPRS